MEKLTKLCAIAMSAVLAASLSACSSTPETPAETQPTETQATMPSVTAPPPNFDTEPVETEPPEDLTSVPSLEDFTKNVNAALGEMTSFEMAFNIKGFVPDANYFTNNKGDMIEHSFTLTTNSDTLHLMSQTKDLNTNDMSFYEEYQTLKDNIVTTLTKYDKRWVDNTPKEMIRYDMMTKSYTSLPLIGVFANSDTTAVDEFSECSVIKRDDKGNYVFTIKNWDVANYDSEFGKHGLCGLFRSTTIADILANSSLEAKDGDCIYVFDKNFRPVSISFDIYNPNNYNAEFYGVDLHGEVKFSKWNAITEIYLPRVNSLVAGEEDETEAAPSQTEISHQSPDTPAFTPAAITEPEITPAPDNTEFTTAPAEEYTTDTTTISNLPIFTATADNQ